MGQDSRSKTGPSRRAARTTTDSPPTVSTPWTSQLWPSSIRSSVATPEPVARRTTSSRTPEGRFQSACQAAMSSSAASGELTVGFSAAAADPARHLSYPGQASAITAYRQPGGDTGAHRAARPEGAGPDGLAPRS